MVLRNLWRRKTRTLLTLLGIAIGVAAVVALSAIGEGWATGFDQSMSTAEADLTVAQKDAVMFALSAVDESVGEELKQIGGVGQVAGVVVGFLSMEDAPYFIVSGHDPRGFAIRHFGLIAGGPLTGRKQILLGKVTARHYEKNVGDNFGVDGVSYRVAGIYETGVSFEDGGAVISLADAQRTFGQRNQVSYYAVKLESRQQTDAIKAQIEKRWSGLAASRSGDATSQSETFEVYRSFGWFLGIFAVLVGGLGMMNTTLMSVFERTREIGVLRALGWRRRRILGLILGESIALAALGGVCGLVLGVLLTKAASLAPAVETLLTGIFTPAIFIQAFATALVLGVAGGLYPAWRASQLEPAEAMRYEGGSGGSLGPITRWLARHLGSGALRNLWRRPTRTLVTITGIGIGVSFIVALIAITEGFSATFVQLGQIGKIDLIAEQAKASDLSLSVIPERTADRIKQQPDVKSVSKILLGFSSAPGAPFLMVWGLDPREEYLKHFQVREGKAIAARGEIMLGRVAVNSVKKGVGESIRIAGTTFRIVGIYENGTAYEDTGAAISLHDAQDIFRKPSQVSLLGIAVKDPARADTVARELERTYPEVIVDKTSTFTQRTQDIGTVNAAVGALVLLTLVVGSIVMMNAMLMSVFERTQEIGVLRALGWKGRRILRMVLVESLALALVSALLGILFGVGLSFLFTLVPVYGTFLIPVYTPGLFAQVLVVALALGAVGGLYPALRATRLRPIEALRYE